jgi:hypothetical protein
MGSPCGFSIHLSQSDCCVQFTSPEYPSDPGRQAVSSVGEMRELPGIEELGDHPVRFDGGENACPDETKYNKTQDEIKTK